MMALRGDATIPAVFDGQSVLITGATGFLGKVLLEKLLRSCPGITEVYILLRESAPINERIEKLLENSVFDRIKYECPDVLRKIRGVPGDLTDKEMKIEGNCCNVSFVFHCAANVRFEDEPSNHVKLNVFGTQKILTLCRSFKNLKAVVHVSTAYAFCNQIIIAEEICRDTGNPDSLIEAAFNLDNDQLAHACTYLGGRPSLYHYSKALAEVLIRDKFRTLPLAIVRPAIITGAAHEPVPGWTDGVFGPSGFIAVSITGFLKTLLVKEKITADWVPVDLVANTVIAAAHYVALKGVPDNIQELRFTSGLPIINCVCPRENQIDWMDVINKCIDLLHKYPSERVFRLVGGTVTSSPREHKFCRYVYHYIPAILIDMFSALFFRKRRLMKDYQRIHKVLDTMQLYTTKRFLFSTQNMSMLAAQMKEADKVIFPIDQTQLNWSQYLDDYVHGVRRYLLKEDDSTLPMARRKLSRLEWLWFSVKLFPVGYLGFYITMRCLKSISFADILSMFQGSRFLHFTSLPQVERCCS